MYAVVYYRVQIVSCMYAAVTVCFASTVFTGIGCGAVSSVLYDQVLVIGTDTCVCALMFVSVCTSGCAPCATTVHIVYILVV